MAKIGFKGIGVFQFSQRLDFKRLRRGGAGEGQGLIIQSVQSEIKTVRREEKTLAK